MPSSPTATLTATKCSAPAAPGWRLNTALLDEALPGSQEHQAAILGLHRVTLTRYRGGRPVRASIFQLELWAANASAAAGLKIPVDDLFPRIGPTR